jgi:hypothetical protein
MSGAGAREQAVLVNRCGEVYRKGYNRGMDRRWQFSLSDSLFASAWAAAGLALVRLTGRSDPAAPVIALSALCCFGAAILMMRQRR